MNKRIINKSNIFILMLTISVFSISTVGFSFWYLYDKINGYIWLNQDASYPKDGWYFLDDNDDGRGSYYYFDKDGKLLMDTITPDYRVVNEYGQLIDNKTGKVVYLPTDQNVELSTEEQQYQLPSEFLKKRDDFIGAAAMAVLNANANQAATVPTQNAQVIIGQNVVFHAEDEYYDPDIDRKVVNHITEGNNYSKKVNGTTFTKIKWTNVISLKGDGAYFVAKNEKNNFNRIKGRIATHYFTYSDRTTICRFSIIDPDSDDEIYSTSSFNYNSGISFDVTFYKTQVSRLRFELSVEGQYPTRVCYIKDLQFGFDKKAYDEEMEELAEEEIVESMYRVAANIGTVSEVEFIEEEYDENGDLIEKGNDDTAGPAFDRTLTATQSTTEGPGGGAMRTIIPGRED